MTLRPQQYDADLNRWLGRAGLTSYDGAAEFVRLAEATRMAQERVAASRPPKSVAADAARRLEEAGRLLREYEVLEADQVAGRLLASPGRGQTLLPPFYLHRWDETSVIGHVRFGRFHLGSNGAVHGGALCLLFDDVLGQLANLPSRPHARTANIRVDYQKITPSDTPLTVSAHVVNQHGRKLNIRGEISDGDSATAIAEGLFIQLRPGQP